MKLFLPNIFFENSSAFLKKLLMKFFSQNNFTNETKLYQTGHKPDFQMETKGCIIRF